MSFDEKFIQRCYNVTEEYEKLWGRWNIDSQLLHIITEIAELKDVLRNKDNKYGKVGTPEFANHLFGELADVFLTSFATAGMLNVKPDDLLLIVREKLRIVEERLKEKKNVNTN